MTDQDIHQYIHDLLEPALAPLMEERSFQGAKFSCMVVLSSREPRYFVVASDILDQRTRRKLAFAALVHLKDGDPYEVMYDGH